MRNLGIIFDTDLSLRKHITSITQTSFYHIAYVIYAKLGLLAIDINSATILANALACTI